MRSLTRAPDTESLDTESGVGATQLWHVFRSPRPRIGVISDWTNPVVGEAIRLLRSRDVIVDLIVPEQGVTELATLRVEHDLYLLKSGTELALSVAGALHALGATTLNPYPAVAQLRNKFIVTRVLQQAGIPTPATYLAFNPPELAPLLDDGPLMVKPYLGVRGEGVRVIRQRRELDELPSKAPTLAQRFHPPDGPDHKLFCIGGALFGVRRPWPLRTYEDKLGEPFRPDAALRELGERCGGAFGIDLFSMDVIFSRGQPYVVDINKFGSYMGVPDGPRLLADYFAAAVYRLRRGEPATPRGTLANEVGS